LGGALVVEVTAGILPSALERMYSQRQRLGRDGNNPSGISTQHCEDCQALANEILLFELSDCVGAVDGNHINDKQLLDPSRPI
jgi:hypothetical protein